MKALRYLNPDILETQNIQSPVCGEGEALIRVYSAGICGTDLAIATGKHPRAKAPLVMGHEFAVQVIEIQPGPVPTDLAVGDKATAYPLLVCGQCWACTNGCEHVCCNLKLIGRCLQSHYSNGVRHDGKISLRRQNFTGYRRK